jgi:hypothetical protein
MSDIKLINYDFVRYGRAAERKRLLDKWDKEDFLINDQRRIVHPRTPYSRPENCVQGG